METRRLMLVSLGASGKFLGSPGEDNLDEKWQGIGSPLNRNTDNIGINRLSLISAPIATSSGCSSL